MGEAILPTGFQPALARRPGFGGAPGFLGAALAPAPAHAHHRAPAHHKAPAHHSDFRPLNADPFAVAALDRGAAWHPDRIVAVQPELGVLPWQMGPHCQLAREPAEALQVRSRAMRALLQAATQGGTPAPDAEVLRAALVGAAGGDDPAGARAAKLARSVAARASGPGGAVPADLTWVDPAAIPALMQLLMAERTTTRGVLVAVLARIPGPSATKALARLAVFDLAPEVRDRAVEALRTRPADDGRPTLLEGLRYPWAPAADHAAEALVALGDRAAVPDLAELADEPDPRGPTPGLRHGRTVPVVRTLVRVNHLRNCLLCHAPSTDPTDDLVRGRIPTPGQPLPPPVQYYGDGAPGRFVRAEVTYLRQDFSVNQPVADAAPWPGHQRFDYLIAERPATAREIKEARDHAGPRTYPQREAALFALRGLAGRDQPAPDRGGPAN